MTAKYKVVGARDVNGVELMDMGVFYKMSDALRYAFFYGGDDAQPRSPEHVGEVLVESLPGQSWRPVTSWTLSPRVQLVGRAIRKPTAFAVAVDKLLEGLKQPEGFVGFITGRGDSSGVRSPDAADAADYGKEVAKTLNEARAKALIGMSFDDLETKVLARLNESSRIPMEQMFKHYGRASYGTLSDVLTETLAAMTRAMAKTEYSTETPEVECNCLSCLIEELKNPIKPKGEAKKPDEAPSSFAGEPPEATESTPVGNPNQDLEDAYEKGFRAAANEFNIKVSEGLFMLGYYKDQRRSDLKELESFNRSF